MKLVDTWSQAWKWFSVHAFALIALLPVAWANLPADVMAYIPEQWLPYCSAIVAVCGIILRLVKQEPKTAV